MRLHRLKPAPRMGMNMTPMIDIVFLLIIFFMTVSQITRSLEEPIQLADVGPDGQPLETVSVTINLDENGNRIVAGRSYEMDDLITALRQELERVGNRPGQLKVLVRCDRNCPGKHVNELTNALAKLGISQVRLSVQGHDRE